MSNTVKLDDIEVKNKPLSAFQKDKKGEEISSTSICKLKATTHNINNMTDANEEITLSKVYEEIVKGRTEVKHLIETSEARVTHKIDILNNRIKELEEANTQLEQKVENLEQETRRKRIVIFGINKPIEGGYSAKYIADELNKLLGTNITVSDISIFFNIGRAQNSPLKVEFISQITKNEILKNCKKLKGTQVSISADLTKIQQEARKILKTHLTNVRKIPSLKSYIRGNKLFINDIPHSAEQLKDLDINQAGYSGVPGTSQSNISIEESSDGEEFRSQQLNTKSNANLSNLQELGKKLEKTSESISQQPASGSAGMTSSNVILHKIVTRQTRKK